MSKQVLTIEQMRNLQELGLGIKETTLYWVRPKNPVDSDTWVLFTWISMKYGEGFDFIPTYTLQDILDILPTSIDGYKLEMGVEYAQSWFAVYINGFQSLRYECEENLIDAAYELLCWAIENGYVETNKKI